MLSNQRAVSDTGPMISAFQSDQVSLLEFLYQGGICIPRSTLPEYLGDSQSLIQGLINDDFVEICDLTQSQRGDAWRSNRDYQRSHARDVH